MHEIRSLFFWIRGPISDTRFFAVVPRVPNGRRATKVPMFRKVRKGMVYPHNSHVAKTNN